MVPSIDRVVHEKHGIRERGRPGWRFNDGFRCSVSIPSPIGMSHRTFKTRILSVRLSRERVDADRNSTASGTCKEHPLDVPRRSKPLDFSFPRRGRPPSERRGIDRMESSDLEGRHRGTRSRKRDASTSAHRNPIVPSGREAFILVFPFFSCRTS